MFASLYANRNALVAHARSRLALAAVVGVISAAIAITILAVDYRLMIFAIIVLAPAVIPAVDAVRAHRRARQWEWVGVECEETEIVVKTNRDEARVSYGTGLRLLARPDGLAIAWRDGDGRWQLRVVPGRPEAVRAVAAALRARSIAVAKDAALGTVFAFIVALPTAVLGEHALVHLAVILVAGGIATIVLALARKGGSLLVGAVLIGGAFACLFVGALVRALVRAAAERDRGNPDS